MSFYPKLTQYYDQIFPVGPAAVNFLAQRYASTPEGKILDIGCGTGGYALALSQRGIRVLGIDLEPGMIDKAQKAAEAQGLQGKVEFRCMDMRKLGDLEQTFDGAYCVGNTLVHLLDLDEVRQFLADLRGTLRPNSRFILQILNYDWILKTGITELPLIRDEEVDLTFKRHYVLPEEPGGLIKFQTRLEIKDEVWEGETTLRPLSKSKLGDLLTDAGFKELSWFSSMDGAPWQEDALPLVVEGMA